jgi:hypothetical protein
MITIMSLIILLEPACAGVVYHVVITGHFHKAAKSLPAIENTDVDAIVIINRVISI